MEHRKELVAVLIVVIGVAIFLVYTAAHAVGQVLSFNTSSPSVSSTVDMSSWQTYTNTTYGFSVNYPQDWQIDTDGLSANDPFVAIGNPLSGTSTYALDIVIEDNSSTLSSGDFVHQMLAIDHAQDNANALSGPAPKTMPQFSKSFLLAVGAEQAYELYNVSEYDHDAEQIYVADGNSMLRFDFPMPEENPNIYLPSNNNQITHEIVNTLMLQ